MVINPRLLSSLPKKEEKKEEKKKERKKERHKQWIWSKKQYWTLWKLSWNFPFLKGHTNKMKGAVQFVVLKSWKAFLSNFEPWIPSRIFYGISKSLHLCKMRSEVWLPCFCSQVTFVTDCNNEYTWKNNCVQLIYNKMWIGIAYRLTSNITKLPFSLLYFPLFFCLFFFINCGYNELPVFLYSSLFCFRLRIKM